MSLSAPTGNAPRARLEVSTWTYHPQPPSAVDPVLDRRTDRLFTTARAIHWSTAAFLVGAVLPAMLDLAVLLPPVVLVLGSVLTVGASIITGLWHQQLRKQTGVPVIPALEDTMEPFANMMRGYQEAFELSLEEPPEDCSPEEAQNLRELQAAARKALKEQRKLTRKLHRQFSIYGELAAQADRRGWRWLRDRHVGTIANLVVQVASQNTPDDETATPNQTSPQAD